MSTADLRRCSRCRNLIDPEDLFCANCGTEAPLHEHEQAARRQRPGWEVYTFDCGGCGACMSYDAREGALRCPFCGATEVQERAGGEDVTYPERMIPFALDRGDAEARFRGWLGKGVWRPGDLKRAASVAGVTALMLPCWCFQGATETCWTADVGASTRSGWRPDSGTHTDFLHGVLVPASGGLRGEELGAIGDFDFNALRPTGRDLLEGAAVEEFGLTRKGARARARARFESGVQGAIKGQLGNRKIRNMHDNVLLSELSSEPILLPVWIFAYLYKGESYRFVMNGQSGTAAGKAPFSYLKLAAVIAGVLALLAGLVGALACTGLLASVASSI